MAAYIVADVRISDEARYADYRALSPAAIAAAGGEFIVRGGKHETLEGNWKPDRMVLLKFPTYEMARAFYDSVLFRAARAKRAGATEHFNLVVVEGI
jgi:uncharacterized protein (DUF1330 family)